MKWITTAKLSAAALAAGLVLCASPLHGQASGDPAATGTGGQAAPAAPHRGEALPAGGANSGGGELPKDPASAIDKLPPPPPTQSQPAPATTALPGKGGTGSPGPGPNPHHQQRRRENADKQATPGSHGGLPGDPPAAVCTPVHLVHADGQPVAGAWLLASSGGGQVLAIALTDASGVALLVTAEHVTADTLHVTVVGAATVEVALPAGLAAEIVLGY